MVASNLQPFAFNLFLTCRYDRAPNYTTAPNVKINLLMGDPISDPIFEVDSKIESGSMKTGKVASTLKFKN